MERAHFKPGLRELWRGRKIVRQLRTTPFLNEHGQQIYQNIMLPLPWMRWQGFSAVGFNEGKVGCCKDNISVYG